MFGDIDNFFSPWCGSAAHLRRICRKSGKQRL